MHDGFHDVEGRCADVAEYDSERYEEAEGCEWMGGFLHIAVNCVNNFNKRGGGMVLF